MKKTIAVALSLGLMVGALVGPADAAKKKKKKVPVTDTQVVEVEYQGGNMGVATPAATGGTCFVDPTMPFSCKEIIPPGPQFKYLKVEVQDATGQKAGGFISQNDNDGDGIQDGYGEFCGAHAEPVELETAGAVVGVSLYPGICSDASGPSIVTTGKIVATFSTHP